MSRIFLFLAAISLAFGALFFGREWFASNLRNMVKEI